IVMAAVALVTLIKGFRVRRNSRKESVGDNAAQLRYFAAVLAAYFGTYRPNPFPSETSIILPGLAIVNVLDRIDLSS
ncbi:hypothetical protein, partial [Klebsiella pneumoniae]|uniref:hypothetical protein n=1 Tax=Klebsiella pneumoniae TaxID=573 RepID=UPI001D0EFF6D